MSKRRCDLVVLDQSILNECIQPLFPGHSVIEYQLMSGGLINTNYKVFISDYKMPFVFRVYARDSDACQRETDISNLVKKVISIPEILYASGSKSPISKPYTIMEWCEGVTLQSVLHDEHIDDVKNAIYEAGSVLAAIASYKFEQAGFFGNNLTIKNAFGNDTTAFMRNCLEKTIVRECLGTQLFEMLSAFIAKNGFCLYQTNK